MTRLLCFAVSLVVLLSAPAAGENRPLVMVQDVEQQALVEEISLTGTVMAKQHATLSSEVSGIVEQVWVEVGDEVKKGDPLIQIDAELVQLILASTQADTLRAKEVLADTERRLADAHALAKKMTVSQNELDTLIAEVQIKQAELAGYEAKEQHQQALLQRYRLLAPFDGVIAHREAELGEWIQPGHVVMQLVSMVQPYIEFKVPQTAFDKLANVVSVDVVLDAFPQQHFVGQVERIIPISDPATRTFRIHIVLNNSNTRFAPGMSASATLKSANGDEAVLVPRDALIRYPDGRVTVWQVLEQGAESFVTERQVKTGLSFNGQIAITEGLQSGATLVTQGNESLLEGQVVRVR